MTSHSTSSSSSYTNSRSDAAAALAPATACRLASRLGRRLSPKSSHEDVPLPAPAAAPAAAAGQSPLSSESREARGEAVVAEETVRSEGGARTKGEERPLLPDEASGEVGGVPDACVWGGGAEGAAAAVLRVGERMGGGRQGRAGAGAGARAEPI